MKAGTPIKESHPHLNPSTVAKVQSLWMETAVNAIRSGENPASATFRADDVVTGFVERFVNASGAA